MKLKIFFLLFILSISKNALPSEKEIFSMSFGPVKIGEERIPINLRDFKVQTETPSEMKLKANFLKNSVQWVRLPSNLLSARARLGIRIYELSPDISLRYLDRSILLQKRKKYLYSELYISLFYPGKITIIKNGKPVGKIVIQASYPQKKTETHLIDYSCSRYGIKIEGLDNEYVSLGCSLRRTGKWGNEKSRLEITWASTNFRLLDKSNPPYVAIMTSSSPVTTTVIDRQGVKRKVTIRARVGKRLYRLRTALGFGPYFFKAKQDNLSRESKLAPSLMLYGNLGLTKDTSIRGFDALVWHDSRFNNLGLYFAYELANTFDQRVSLVALLGIQGLTFQYNKHQDPFSQIIYPQGFELLIRHLGWENYHFFYGMFISPSSDYDYKNLWARYGKKYFWEINYIEWGYSGKSSSMWGLSVGIPFMSFI